MMNTAKTPVLLLLGIFVLTAPLQALGKSHKPPVTDSEEQDEADEPNDTRNPSGCKDAGYQFDLKTLKLLPSRAGGTQSLYLFRNISNQTVNLYQMRDGDSSRTMYLNHSINPGQWSAFATSETPIKYLCTHTRAASGKAAKTLSAYGDLADCSESVHVCEFVDVKFGLNNAGNFWFVNSSTRNGAVREVVHYGIIPEYRMTEARQKKLSKRKEANARKRQRHQRKQQIEAKLNQ